MKRIQKATKMSHFLILSLFLTVAMLASAERACALPPGAGQLVWSDEFDGTALDTSKWSYRDLGPRRNGINTTQAVSVGNGQLTIKTYSDSVNSIPTHYTGMIGTQGKFEHTHGYFEARILFNDHHVGGMWSAFWLQSPTYGMPIGDPATAGVEIDIMEHHARLIDGDLHTHDNMGIHWDGYAEHHKSNYASVINSGMEYDTWHTYGVLWTPESYTFYINDQPMVTITDAVSQRSQYIILSSEVMGPAWFGFFEDSTTYMAVDYVRIYALPEPGSLGLLALGGAWALLRRRSELVTASRH